MADEVRQEALLPAKMNTCHCGGEIKTNDSTDNDRDGGTNYQDNSIGKMLKLQERRCATPYSFENRDWLPYLIDSHALEIAKAESAKSAAKEALKKEKPSPCVSKIKTLLKG